MELTHLSYRELLRCRALASRRRRRDPGRAQDLLERIDAELERRRQTRLNRSSVLADLTGL